jgi:hypothetical protein
MTLQSILSDSGMLVGGSFFCFRSVLLVSFCFVFVYVFLSQIKIYDFFLNSMITCYTLLVLCPVDAALCGE